ncbi:MAG: nucleoside hydrolase [Thaumarchaeota archaeon]|nr:nucleoside hydrolase [Nitrososphaerota archaeon]
MIKKKILIDCDPGIDDALAMILALNSPELDVKAITTVAGNLDANRTSENALKVLELCGRPEIPVTKGSQKPLFRGLYPDFFSHGRDGLGEVNLPKPRHKLHTGHAVDMIINMAKRYPSELTVVTTGPLTNIALALLKEPRLSQEIKEHVMMGGLFGLSQDVFKHPTGPSPVSEWNVYVDPEAFKVVLESGLKTTAVGLDITTSTALTAQNEHLKQLLETNTKLSVLAARMMKFIMDRGLPMHFHDPMAIVYAIKPSLFTVKRFKAQIEVVSELTRGQILIDQRLNFQWDDSKPSINVATGVNAKDALNLILQRLA